MTIGLDFSFMIIKIDNTLIQFVIWDTCGFDKHHCMNTNFYRDASLAIVVYSIDDIISFDHVFEWIKYVKELSPPNVKIILVGNKNDLENQRKIPTEFVLNYSLINNYKFYESSSKTGHNARNIFTEAAKELLEEQMSADPVDLLNHSAKRISLKRDDYIETDLGHSKKTFNCC